MFVELTVLAVLLVAAGVFCLAVVVWWQARLLLRPPRMTPGKAKYLLNRIDPADIGLAFEPADFHIRHNTGESTKISGWWIPRAGGSRSVVLVHGYADAKVGAIALAPMWLSLGFNVLAIDLRAHGESGGATITAGRLEALDLVQVIHQHQARQPQASRHIVVHALSFGCAAAVKAACDLPELSGLVCDSPFDHFAHAIATHASRLTLPLPTLQPCVVWLAQLMCGSDFDELAPTKTLLKCQCPVMLILGSDDPFLAGGALESLEQAMADRNNARDRVELLQGVDHLQAFMRDPNQYREIVRGFVESL